MKCYVLTGDDSWAIRAERATILTRSGVAARSVERFDLATDGGDELVSAGATFSLFGGPRLLDAEPLEELTEVNARRLSQLDTDVTIVLRGVAAPTAALKRALAGADLVTCRTPTGRGIAMRVDALAEANGVRLRPEVRQTLIDRGGSDLPRVAGLLAQLALLGLTFPTEAQVDRLLGTAAAAGVPWALSDAVEVGDVAAALELAGALEPVAVVAYLANRTGQLGRIVDDELEDPDAIMGAFGLSHRFPAQKLAQLAARTGRGGVAASWDAVAAADRAVKTAADPHAALDILLVRLCRLWGPNTTT
jgi:DNA polymerase III delta subunit